MGTLNYLAPEQRISAKTVDGRADLFSIGVILYELIAGVPPIGSFTPPSRLGRGYDRRWDEVIRRALAPSPDDRFQRAEELGAAIRALRVRRRSPLALALSSGIAAAAAIATAIVVGALAASSPRTMTIPDAGSVPTPAITLPPADAMPAPAAPPPRPPVDAAPVAATPAAAAPSPQPDKPTRPAGAGKSKRPAGKPTKRPDKRDFLKPDK
jgi:serine/threonine protein kinase